MSDLNHAAFGRHAASARAFLRDENGGATIWNLSWLLGFAIMAGVSIDSTNGWRNKTMLQSTADVSALAGALDVPNPLRQIPYDATPDAYDGSVKSKAREYADKNQGLGADEYGDYLTNADILIGNWNKDTRTFTPGDDFATPNALSVNAVQVDLFQSETSRGNGVPMQVLGAIGWSHWEVATTATAMIGYPECFGNAVMAQDEVCIRSNNYFYAGHCIHGESGVNFRNNNYWETDANGDPLVGVSSNGADNVADGNYENGMPQVETKSWITEMPDLIHAIAEDMMGGDLYFTNSTSAQVTEITGNSVTGSADPTAWLDTGIQIASLDGFSSVVSLLGLGQSGSNGGGSTGCDQGGSSGTLLPDYTGDLTQFVTSWGESVSGGTLEKGNTYYYAGNNKLNLSGNLDGVTIISEAEINIAAGAVLSNVALLSMDDKGISIGQGAQIGEDDDCQPGGGVQMYSRGKIDSPSSTTWYGAFLVSGGNIHIAAQSDGIQGISAHAKGNVSFTSNSSFGPVGSSGVSDLGTCPVDFRFHDSVLGVALVE